MGAATPIVPSIRQDGAIPINTLTRFLPDSLSQERRELRRLLAMMGLYFLVLFAVGILRPIKNALALDGLAQTQFYKVYLVSAVVVLFAPAINYLADRIPWKRLIPASAAFFALNLIVFRVVYSEGSATLGMVFYGWYDLFAAALLTQFFMAVQVFFNSRDAKSAIPLVIAAGSCGATLGGITTGVLAQTVGTPNLLVLAAVFVAAFAVVLPAVWQGYPPVGSPGRKVRDRNTSLSTTEFARIFSHRHIQLIASLVLITVLVKTLVDYEFNEAVAAYAGDRDAITSFQGYVFGAINWLPIVILLPLGPLLRRWGVGLAVLMLPLVMLGSTVALAAAFSVWVATVAKAADATFRYSAERTGREILYVPLPAELKLKAKAYIDVAVEKGLGKALSGGLIWALLLFLDYRQVAWAAAALAVVWTLLALRAKQEYVSALADSIRGRFASLHGGFATLTERSTLAMVEEALRGDTVDVAFGLDLVEQAGSVYARPLADELDMLLDHPSPEIRTRVLRLLGRFPGLVHEGRIGASLDDDAPHVREAAVQTLAAVGEEPAAVFQDLLSSPDHGRRHAALSVLLATGSSSGSATEASVGSRVGSSVEAEGAPGRLGVVDRSSLGRHFIEGFVGRSGNGGHGSPARDGTPSGNGFGDGAWANMGLDGESPGHVREEIALAAGLLNGDPGASTLLAPLLEDPDRSVARAALRSAGVVGAPELHASILSSLADGSVREAARDALVAQGPAILDRLETSIRDPRVPDEVRRQIPRVLARIPSTETVRILLDFVAEEDGSWEVRYGALRALSKLRARHHADLEFAPTTVLGLLQRVVESSTELARIRASLERIGASGPGIDLLARATDEAWRERQDAAFRLLALVHPPSQTYRSYLTLTRGDSRSRANALEWLERTLDRDLFARIQLVLDSGGGRDPTLPLPSLQKLLSHLRQGPDPWLSAVATWNQNHRRADGPGARSHEDEARDEGESTPGDASDLEESLNEGSHAMDLIEKLFLLQKVDLLQGARSSHLALLASIADEVDVSPGEVLIRRGEPNDSLYVVVRGEVELRGMEDQTLLARQNTPFGTWSIIDSDPSIVSATAIEESHLLRITRSDFQDLLADHPELAMGILQGLARRVRSLVA